MPRQSTRLHVPHLRYKLDVLCAQLRRNQDSLATELCVSPNTLSEYINGVASKPSKPPESMPAAKVDLLAKLLQRSGRQGISSQQAVDALRSADKDVFASLFQPRRAGNLAELLAGRSSELVITTYVVPLQMRRALADQDADDRPVPSGPVRLNHAVSGVKFRIFTEPGARLFCACSYGEHLIQVIPGSRHSGSVTKAWELVPQPPADHIQFLPSEGRHRFIFIQASAPTLQARALEHGLKESLQGHEIEALASQLADLPLDNAWKWGEVVIEVE
ncbi:hypothetical protein JY96_06365 [Aquabacterium sp. NJ1]|uniref:hypothetical protein n=1 Tax=Aquabacterium sp. NJ1 TaxID=1538295 RepID=UPI00052B5BFD|nr:hypothetical protein [Aquabacterium sp. NJ1]KGM39778.1 hypothetical protein JY96_06365 [Aquabacterium sp. NJ1]